MHIARLLQFLVLQTLITLLFATGFKVFVIHERVIVLQALIPLQFAAGSLEVFIHYKSQKHVVDVSTETSVNDLRDVLSDILSLRGLDEAQWWLTFQGKKLKGDTLLAELGMGEEAITLQCVSQGLQVFIRHDDLERALGSNSPSQVRPELTRHSRRVDPF